MKKAHVATARAESVNFSLLTATSAAMLTLIPVAAHQMGLLSHLRDPPSGIFASDKITESSAAHPLGIPDGVLGLASYGLTFTLVLFAPGQPLVRKLLAAKLVADGSMATFNVVRQITSFGKLCSWCTATAICTAAMIVASRRSSRSLRV